MTGRHHICDGRDLGCRGCSAIARRDALVRRAMTTDDRLDDLSRLRIWNGVAARVLEPRRRWLAARVAIAAGVLAAAAVLAVVVGGRDGADRLVVAPDATLTSALGPHARAALVGPAELEVVGAAGDATVARLYAGTLLADFTGGPGRSLVIHAPGAVVEVVGTLFAVAVERGGTCVSVVHGTVRVTTGAYAVAVPAGEAFCTDRGARPIAPAVREALARHAATLARTDHPDPASSPAPRRSDAVTAPAARVDANAKATAAPPPARDRSAAVAARTTTPANATATPGSGATANVVDAPAATPVRDTAIPTPAAAATTPASTGDTSTNVAGAARTTPAGSTPSTPPAIETAESLYRTAEAALAARDEVTAERALARLAAAFPASPLVEQALYERARLAYGHRAWATARSSIDRVLALPGARLAEPARYLACRIAVEARDADAVACLAAYRRAYPRSPHDRDVLALRVQLEHAAGGCRAAAPSIGELARSYPRDARAAAWRARCPEAP